MTRLESGRLTVAELARRILAATTDHPLRVAIDGRSAAGKTTLANALADELRRRTGRTVIRAELDYFMTMVEDPDAYPYDSPASFYLDTWDYPAIRAQLLVPLGPGGDRRYRANPRDPQETAPDDAILLADGVFIQRTEVDDHWDLRIYLDVGLDESVRRVVERDQHWMGSAAEAERRYHATYLPGEERYLAEVRPRDRAQIVVDTSDPARPRIVRQAAAVDGSKEVTQSVELAVVTDSSRTGSALPAVRDVVDALDRRYPASWAEQWDRVGLVLGDFDSTVEKALCVVDCVPETVDQALALGANLIVAHHPLLLKPVSSIAPDTYKGRIIHRLIRADIALYAAHTNADVANPGVSDALAARLGLVNVRPLVPAVGAAEGGGRGIGRVGELSAAMLLDEFVGFCARSLPPTSGGVRAAGDPERVVRSVAVCGGAGDPFLADATAAGVDAYVCADLRHHPASEHVAEGGPALVDVAHWASERPWLDEVAGWLRGQFPIDVIVSDLDTDPWTVHAVSPMKELLK